MSNVFQRHRKETNIKFLLEAREFNIAITEFIMDCSIVPVQMRQAVGYGIIHKADELIDNLSGAYHLTPQNSKDFELRTYYINNAYVNIWQLHDRLVKLIEVLKLDDNDKDKLFSSISILEYLETAIIHWKEVDKKKYKAFVI